LEERDGTAIKDVAVIALISLLNIEVVIVDGSA
jgi:hypothetical protein